MGVLRVWAGGPPGVCSTCPVFDDDVVTVVDRPSRDIRAPSLALLTSSPPISPFSVFSAVLCAFCSGVMTQTVGTAVSVDALFKLRLRFPFSVYLATSTFRSCHELFIVATSKASGG